MKLFPPFLLLLIFVAAFTSPSAQAKAYYAPEGEMVKKAEFIAIVDITMVEKVETKSEPFSYSELAQARVVQSIKGNLPEKVRLHGGEDFICAQVHFQPGRYLVFLRLEKGLFTGCNWHYSVRPIAEGKVEWYQKAGSYELSWQALDAVLERVRIEAQTEK